MKKLTTTAIAVLSICALCLVFGSASVQAAPTDGLHQYTDTYTVQHPYNLPESARFSVTAGPTYNALLGACSS